jgi:glyoxylase-like metal-dependent hydrolase (beta-lactamase superfamily II)
VKAEARTRAGVRFPWPEAPGPGEIIEVAEGVLWARIGLPNRLNHVNIYLLDDGDAWTVIDTGFRNKMCLEHWDLLRAGPLKGRRLWRVVGTHHHPDHIGLVGRMMREDGVEFWTTRTAYILARMLQLDHHEHHPPEQIAHWKRGGTPPHLVEEFSRETPFNFSRTVDPLPLGYRRIVEGEVIRMGGRDWDVRMGDGHAPEHATFWSRDDDLVIVGDQAIPGISSNLGVQPTEPEADPVGDWLESCERLLRHAREEHVALPGHKPVFTGLPLRFEQLISNHHTAIDRLRGHLTDWRTAVECFVPIFGREIGPPVYGLAMNEALGHLNHMHRTGEAERETGADGAWRFRLAR